MDENPSPKSPALHHQAIEAALKCDWNSAIELNKELIKDEPTNTACLNRLARALCELGKYTQAKKIYQEVLEFDPYNIIARKNLKKISAFKNRTDDSPIVTNGHVSTIMPGLFLEEPGMTKIVSVVKTAEPQKLSTLSAGMMVNIVPKNRGITVTGADDSYLGILPDDLSHHLSRLIKGGNKYSALIKSVKTNGISLLIREVYRSRKFRNQPSFLDSSKVVTLSSEHITLNTDGDDRVDDEANEEPEEFENFPR